VRRLGKQAAVAADDPAAVLLLHLVQPAELLEQRRLGPHALLQPAAQPRPVRRDAMPDRVHDRVELRRRQPLAPGIGHRIDGAPNRDLEVGKILAKLPIFSDSQKAILRSWPKGTYDPRLNFDGRSTPLVLPPAHGLAQVVNETYTAEGPISYWNAYVAVTQMHGHGSFSDERLGVSIRQEPDMVTPRLAALRAYQHSLQPPPPPGAFYDKAMARRGRDVFDASCASCHVGRTLTDNNTGVLHAPAETGMDATFASRTTQKAYRTTPRRGLWQHGPYFHDGSARTLEDVVDHYVRARGLRLSGGQRRDLVEYLKSL
jgi:mono/diheme cytochrome c family protein